MELVVIIITALVAMVGLFGDTFDKQKRKLKKNGIALISLIFVLAVVQLFQYNSDEKKLKDRDARIIEMSKNLLTTNRMLEESKRSAKETSNQLHATNQMLKKSEQQADTYHREMVLYQFRDSLPQNFEVSVKSNYINLADFDIVIRNGGAWEVWLDNFSAFLCPSSTSQGNESGGKGWDMTPFQGDFENCLAYETNMGGNIWVSSNQENKFPKSDYASCVTCPLGDRALMRDEVYDIFSESSVYKDDFGTWDEKSPLESKFTPETGTRYWPILGYSLFFYKIDWDIDPVDIAISRNSSFSFETLMNQSDELDIFLVPERKDVLRVLEFSKEELNIDLSCHQVMDDFVSQYVEMRYEDFCDSVYYQYPIKEHELAVLLDDFELTLSYGEKSKVFTEASVGTRGYGIHLFMKNHLKLGTLAIGSD